MLQRRERAISSNFRTCQWVSLHEALYHFARHTGPPQSQRHIKPLHWYVASRLVIEGGFHPDDVTPRPPFSVVARRGKTLLEFDPSQGAGGERTILGGLKTKNVDVVVTKEGIGPVMAVSCKGMSGAFRNLTNRMEETIGECTNLHITYPAMVFGYLFVIKANRDGQKVAGPRDGGRQIARHRSANDIAILHGNEPVEMILRFHAALRELTGRGGIRNDVSRYEAVSVALVESRGAEAGSILSGFPPPDSPLRIERFFRTLYLRYEERYLYGAPDLKSITKRLEWSPESQVFQEGLIATGQHPRLDYAPRLAADLDT